MDGATGTGVPASSSATAPGRGVEGGHPLQRRRGGGHWGDLWLGQMTKYWTVATKNYCDITYNLDHLLFLYSFA